MRIRIEGEFIIIHNNDGDVFQLQRCIFPILEDSIRLIHDIIEDETLERIDLPKKEVLKVYDLTNKKILGRKQP